MNNEVEMQKQKDEKETLSRNIIFLRKKSNLSQIELAKKLNTSNKNISKWEHGETTPDIFTIKKLALIFGVTVDTMINPISNDNKIAIKTNNAIPFRWKVYMLLMANAILILLASILFFTFKLKNINIFPLGYIYIYILPLIDLSIFIFVCCTKKCIDVLTSSLFGWLVTLCFYITFKSVENIGYIFIITIGWQILIPIIAMLINSGKIIYINKRIIEKFEKFKSQKKD